MLKAGSLYFYETKCCFYLKLQIIDILCLFYVSADVRKTIRAGTFFVFTLRNNLFDLL